jgi:hypothetical protein
MKRHCAPGLTLIDLLIVIAAISLLTAVLFPVLTQRRMSGCGPPTCISNLKFIGLAAAMYQQDYDDTLFWNPDPGGLPASTWASSFRPSECADQPHASFVALLLPYLKNPHVLQCPQYPGYDLSRHLGYEQSVATAQRELHRSADDPPVPNPDWIHKIGYGFNEVLVASPCRPRKLSSLRHYPGDIALFADAEQPWASSQSNWVKVDGEWSRYWIWDPSRKTHHEVGEQHQVGQNFVYLDGHAKFLQPRRRAGAGEQNKSSAGYYPDALLE